MRVEEKQDLMNKTLPALFHEARITLEVTKVSCCLVFLTVIN